MCFLLFFFLEKKIFNQKSKSENIIFDLLSVNIREFNKNEFEDLGVEKNSGVEVHKYKKELDTLELGLFNLIEVAVFSAQEASVYLFCNREEIDVFTLKELINKFYKAYGKDTFDMGKFSDDEMENVLLDDHWNGRMWTDIKPEITFSLTENRKIQLGILGVQFI